MCGCGGKKKVDMTHDELVQHEKDIIASAEGNIRYYAEVTENQNKRIMRAKEELAKLEAANVR